MLFYDRDKLYNEIWKNPMTKVAIKYNLSDRGLAKMCAKLNIPRPSRGYWAKIKAGQKVNQQSLSILENYPKYIINSHQATYNT